MELSVKFIPAKSPEQLLAIHQLAPILWQHAYSEILSQEQIAYMIDWMYSMETLKKSAGDSTRFFLIEVNAEICGFIGLTPRNSELISLDKLYLHKKFHGFGVGQKALNFACDYARKNSFDCIELHVNKNNLKAQKAYLKNGFQISKTVVTDIGNNFVMDDYLMTKQL